MNGVATASVSPGSSHFGASVTWIAHVIWPSGAAAAGAASPAVACAATDSTRRPSDRERDPMAESSLRCDALARCVWRSEDITQPDPPLPPVRAMLYTVHHRAGGGGWHDRSTQYHDG